MLIEIDKEKPCIIHIQCTNTLWQKIHSVQERVKMYYGHEKCVCC